MIQTALELADFHPPQRRTLPQACFICPLVGVAKPVSQRGPFKNLITLADIFSTLKFRDWVYVQ